MNPPKNLAAFVAKIHASDEFEHLGNGVFANVYGNKTDGSYVIKIGTNLKDGYLKYLKLVEERHEDNPFSPRIYWWQVYADGYIVKLERLAKCVDRLSHQDVNYKKWEAARAFLAGRKVGELDPPLVRILQDLMAQKTHKIDCHNENAMVTADGTRLVVTDPLSYPLVD